MRFLRFDAIAKLGQGLADHGRFLRPVLEGVDSEPFGQLFGQGDAFGDKLRHRIHGFLVFGEYELAIS